MNLPSEVFGHPANVLLLATQVAVWAARRQVARLQLEGLFLQGIWVVTRLDDQYPARLRETLKHQAPTVRGRDCAEAPKGNRELLELGAAPMSESEMEAIDDLPGWLEDHVRPNQKEGDLFG